MTPRAALAAPATLRRLHTATTETCDHAPLRPTLTVLSHLQQVSTRGQCTRSTLSSSPAWNGSTTPLFSVAIHARQCCRPSVSSLPNARTPSDRLPSHSGRNASRASNACRNDHGNGASPATKRRLWKRINVSHYFGFKLDLFRGYLFSHVVLPTCLTRALISSYFEHRFYRPLPARVQRLDHDCIGGEIYPRFGFLHIYFTCLLRYHHGHISISISSAQNTDARVVAI